MGLFDIFRKRRKCKTRKKRRPNSTVSRPRQNFTKLKSDIENIQAEIKTLNIILHKHDDDITEHTILIGNHCKELEKLEQIVAKPAIIPSNQEYAPISRPIDSITPLLSPVKIPERQQEKFDISRFSEQEKRILSVFFQNHDMALSYVDIGSTLNKSPNTVKNQIRQIDLKANLFDKTIDSDQRNRFKLKDGLKIEKYLNIHE